MAFASSWWQLDRLDGSLFNIRRLQAVTKVTNDTIFDLQYADDVALPSHTPDGLQRQLVAISSAYSRAGLVVNSKKTEVLYLPSDLSLPPTFYISEDQLGLTEHFTYLGSIITSTCYLTAEIQRSVNLGSASFRRLSKQGFTKPWPFRTRQDGHLQRNLHLDTALSKWGMDTVPSSHPSPFTFGVFKLSCTCTGGTKYLMLRFAAEQAQHALRRYYSEDNWGGLAMW